MGGGGGIRGISGGERRRVTIGMELVTGSRLLVMDEATSGLDSYTALQLLRTCQQVTVPGNNRGTSRAIYVWCMVFLSAPTNLATY